LKLKPRGKPYYRLIGERLHLGYRRNAEGVGKWVARRYVGDQKYVVETIASADDVDDSNHDTVLTYFEAQDRARSKRGYTGPYRVRDAWEAYLSNLGAERSYHPRTRGEKHILPSLGDKLVDALTPEELRKWRHGLVKEDSDPEKVRRRKVTANRILDILKAVLNLAFHDKRAQSDTAWRRVKAFAGVAVARTRYLTVEEAQRFLNACDPDFRLLCRGALETGARYGELCRLECSDFNPDSDTVHIRQSKSGKSRHIILTKDGARFFSQLCAGRKGDSPMFGRVWTDWQQKRPMAAACERAKIEPIGFHGLRHTWASLSVMGGMPLQVVAKNLGHRDTKMVELHYGHLAENYVVKQVQEFGPKYGIADDTNIVPMGAKTSLR
jgi:integrase